MLEYNEEAAYLFTQRITGSLCILEEEKIENG